jgi:choline/glycine/proline betaine transport protein
MSRPVQEESTAAPEPGSGVSTSRARILRPVFVPASVVIIGVIALVIVFRDEAEALTTTLNRIITDGVGWWYVIAVNIFLVFSLYCALSRIGRIRLGRNDEQPEFGLISWFMMLFSAGMGIGLVFFGVAEPLSHYVIPPEAFGAAPESIQAAQESIPIMMLQWGLHPWAIYAVVGLGLAYMTYRRGRPLAVRWLLEPLLGRRRIEGWMGHTIDVIAIVGTLFGIATSFGFGVSQIVSGLDFLGWIEPSNTLVIGLIAVITACAIWSVVSGVHKGLKWLSNFNMSIAALLALTVFILGPTLFLLKAFPQNIGGYLSMLPVTMLHTGPFTTDGWEAAWTIAYWGWWTSWAPFVGMFIARISRGRTIREFIFGTLLAPTVASLVWFTIFGGSAILVQRETGSLAVDGVVDSTTSLFQFLDTFPLATVLSFVAVIVIVFFFITSSDSGSLVIDMLASGGNTDTPVATRVYWSVLEGVAAAVLLVIGGSAALTALQTIAISTAAPFSVILVLACISLLKSFRHEVATLPHYMEVLPAEAGPRPEGIPAPSWRGRLQGIRDFSATFAGLPGDMRPADQSNSQPIVSYRQIDPGNMTMDPETGRFHLEREPDPLAGEIFDTPEFPTSQEYLDQRKDADSAQRESALRSADREESPLPANLKRDPAPG